MMKTTVAVALLAVAAQADVVLYKTGAGDFLPDDAACAGIEVKKVKNGDADWAQYLVAKADADPAPDAAALAACAVASSFEGLETEKAACVKENDDDVPVYTKGGSVACPLAKDEVCTTTQVCEAGSSCVTNGQAGADNATVCTEVNDVWSVAFKSHTEPFFPLGAGTPATVAGDAFAAAKAKVPACVDDALKLASGFVSKKDFKQYTGLAIASKTCNDKISDFKTALAAELKTATEAAESKNKITVDSVKRTHSVADLNKCAKTAGGFGCSAEIEGCTAVLCNPEVECTDNKQCGTGSCKKQAAPTPSAVSTLADEIKVCSGSAITSAVFAVGAAALAAVAFF